MGLIDFTYIAESYSSDSNLGSFADWAGVIVAMVAAYYAKKAFDGAMDGLAQGNQNLALAQQGLAQAQQIAVDSQRPLMHVKFEITSQWFSVELSNRGLGPLLLNNDVSIEFNNQVLPWQDLIPTLSAEVFRPIGIIVDLQNSRRSRLGQGDVISVTSPVTILDVHYTFEQPTEGRLTALKDRLSQYEFTVRADFHSIYNQQFPQFEVIYGQN